MSLIVYADFGCPACYVLSRRAAVSRTPLTGPILRRNSAADPLRESGYAVCVGRGPITTDAYRRIRAWRTEWHDLGSPELPLVLAGDATVTGLEAVRRFGEERHRYHGVGADG